jgi:hypothetical protein
MTAQQRRAAPDGSSSGFRIDIAANYFSITAAALAVSTLA